MSRDWTFYLEDIVESCAKVQRYTHAIFRRDKGICQLGMKCGESRLTWDDWHCDHIVPWSKGGKTTVENGQVLCPDCNLAKGAG